MKHIYIFLFAFFSYSFLNAQTVNIPDVAFKEILLNENCVDTNGDNVGDSIIDLNNDGEIQVSEAESVINLVIPTNQYNNTSTGVVSYIADMTGIEGFSNIQKLFIDSPSITNSGTFALDLGINNINLEEITISNLPGLSDLNLGSKPNLTNFDIYNTLELNNIDVSNCQNLNALYLGMTSLSSIDITQNVNLVSFGTEMYFGSNIDFSQNINLESISFGYSGITAIDLSNNINLTSFSGIGFDNITELDFSNNPNLVTLNCYQGFMLESINLKNRTAITNLDFSNCDMLNSVCVDNNEFDLVSNLITQYGYTNCSITNYCTLNPAGTNYIVEGSSTLDSNNNGCGDATDVGYNNLKLNISNGTYNSTLFANNSGDYELHLLDGLNTITAELPNSDYYNISPSNVSVDFPTDASPFNLDFCISPNITIIDTEIYVIPITEARPGFDAIYRVIYKNVGNTVVSGSVEFNYNSDFVNYVSSSIAVDQQIANTLVWDYIDLQPLEQREILVTMNLNTPTDIDFPLNDGDILSYSAIVNPIPDDETPFNNTHSIRQDVVNSFDPNDKRCLEGNEIELDKVGEYLHYMIRFENTGTASAVNIVVKDIIDETKFDMASFIPLHASHNFVTRIQNNNEVEFIFENINLPFDDASNDGYVVFKIKTHNTLVVGDTFSNEAEIYFDFNFPIITNNETVTVVTNNLSVEEFEYPNVSIYPNPVKEVFFVNTNSKVNTVLVYNINGQIVKEIKLLDHAIENKVEVSDLAKGIYFVKLNTDKGEFIKKLIKL
ncbi:T9SS type A sorting domain-containing protein [uncultured Lacinutrix sp.]|uniref:T9SS type A sorting domain-containing protein n=1 Tax=uncultured Lacinutrix sp. TaxID=574032 RepID=UPI002624A000|nr:T9SS type A sorting domain-containing protein [uncultured Lacinutrix sp.]